MAYLYIFLFTFFYFCGTNKMVYGEHGYWWRRLLEQQYHMSGGYYSRYLKQNPTYQEYMRKGVLAAASECRRLFRYNRWNCTSTNPQRPFGNIVEIGCRETAFVYAITSAGLTYHMIQACSEGKVWGCYNRCLKSESVDPKTTRLMNETHSKNEACDDNILFGVKVWENFVYSGEKSSDIRARFNVRNSQVGLQNVYKSKRLLCRCHGPSRSCSLQICSEKIANNFKPIGEKIFESYLQAKFDTPDQNIIESNAKSMILQRENSMVKTNPVARRSRRGHMNEVKHMEFYDFSPDYCQKSDYALGTKNRLCHPYVSLEQYNNGARTCNEICCYGRGARTIKAIIRTNCKFVYCCTVNCDEETRLVEEYYCL